MTILFILVFPSHLKSGDKNSLIYFDSKKTSFNFKTDQHMLKGGAFLAFEGIFVTADSIAIDRKKNEFVATGHVVIVLSSRLILADKVYFDKLNSHYRIINGEVFSGHQELADQYRKKIFEISDKEKLSLEKKEGELQKILKNKNLIRSLYQNENVPSDKKNEYVDRYIILLEKEKLLRQVGYLVDHPSKDTYHFRRKSWEALKKKSKFAKNLGPDIYIMIRGNSIVHFGNGTTEARKTFFSPCKCGSGETPDWGVRSDFMKLVKEDYVYMYDSVLEIKGVPVLYSPRMIFPTKSKRQTGLLIPKYMFYEGGQVFSQDMYYALTDFQDTTVTYDWFSERGHRLGLEYRFKGKHLTKFEVKGTLIRDKQWLSEKYNSQIIYDNYFDSYQEYKVGKGSYKDNKFNNKWWQDSLKNLCSDNVDQDLCVKQALNSHMKPPKNDWRGDFVWSLGYSPHENISFLSEGELLSDHLYESQANIVEQGGLLGGSANFDLYKKIAVQSSSSFSHDYFLSFGSHVFDVLDDSQRFSGLQNPLFVNISSRYFSFGPDVLPSYFNIGGEIKEFNTWVPSDYVFTKEKASLYLDRGHWQSAYATVVTPYSISDIGKLNFETKFKAMHVQSKSKLFEEYLDGFEKNIKLDSYGKKAALRFELMYELPLIRKFIKSDGFVDHEMSYSLGYSIQPWVYQEGRYGLQRQIIEHDSNANLWKEDNKSSLLLYSSEGVDNSFSRRHSKIKFETRHRILCGSKLPGNFSNIEFNEDSSDLRASVIRELSKHHEDSNDNEPVLYSNRDEILSFSSSIDYDYFKVYSPDGPWGYLRSRVDSSVGKFSLSFESKYHVKFNAFDDFQIRTSCNPFLNTAIAYRLFFDNDLSKHKNIRNDYQQKTHYLDFKLHLNTSYFFETSCGYRHGRLEEQYPIMSLFSFTYVPKSECWGVRFQWKKDFGLDFNSGFYYLGFVIKFLGHTKEYGNFAEQINRKKV